MRKDLKIGLAIGAVVLVLLVVYVAVAKSADGGQGAQDGVQLDTGAAGGEPQPAADAPGGQDAPTAAPTGEVAAAPQPDRDPFEKPGTSTDDAAGADTATRTNETPAGGRSTDWTKLLDT